MQKSEIQCRRNKRVMNEYIILIHSIFEPSEMLRMMLEKIIEERMCIRTRDGKFELDIGIEIPLGFRYEWGILRFPVPWRGMRHIKIPIFMIIIPFPTERHAMLIEEDMTTFSHISVERIHDRWLRKYFSKFAWFYEKLPIRYHDIPESPPFDAPRKIFFTRSHEYECAIHRTRAEFSECTLIARTFDPLNAVSGLLAFMEKSSSNRIFGYSTSEIECRFSEWRSEMLGCIVQEYHIGHSWFYIANMALIIENPLYFFHHWVRLWDEFLGSKYPNPLGSMFCGGTFFVSLAFFWAIEDIFPVIFPFFSHTKWLRTYDTKFIFTVLSSIEDFCHIIYSWGGNDSTYCFSFMKSVVEIFADS